MYYKLDVTRYLKDVSADRITGYETLPVKYGRNVTVLVSSGLLAIALLASARVVSLSGLFARPGLPGALITAGLWVSGACALTAAHGLAMAIRRDDQAHRAIAWTVRGFVLLHLSESAALKPSLVWLALLLYALFEVALAMRPEKSQI